MKDNRNISKWFILYSLLWIFSLSIFGIIEAGNGLPTMHEFLRWETLMVIVAPVLITLLFYRLFNKLKWWIVFILTFVLGAIMTFEIIIQKNTGTISNFSGEMIFTVLIWPVLIMIPYVFTKISDKHKVFKIIFTILLALFLVIQIYRLA